MATGESKASNSRQYDLSPVARTAMALGAFGIAIVACQYLVLRGIDPGTVGYWYVNICFPAFPALAGLRSYQAASALSGRERVAWLLVTAGCASMFAAESFWGYLEVANPTGSPMTAWASAGYVVSPVFFVAGILAYQDQSRVAGTQWVRVGNLGIVFSSVVFVYLLVVYQLLRAGGVDIALIKTFQGAIVMAATVSGLVLFLLRFKGKKRTIMMLLVGGMLCVIAEYFGFIFSLINDSSAWTNAYSVLYLVASTFWFAAASMQAHQPLESRELDDEAEREEHAKQSETLLPAFAVGGVFVVGLFYGQDLTREVVPYLLPAVFVLVCSLGVRNWWAQRVESLLRETLRGQATDLIEAKEMAEAADIAKSRFLSWVSHETRTPLSGVLGFSELLENRHYGELNEEQAGFVKGIRESGNHLLELIDDLLDVTKITMGSVSLAVEKVQPDEVVVEVVQNVELGIGQRAITIVNEVGPNTPVLSVDRRRFRQCLYNLLSNAVKFTSSGRSVGIRWRVEQEGWLCLEVWDQGIGIDESDLNRVFEDFYQVDRKRDEALGGSGIGLAVTRRLAELHGGRVRVRSQMGRGSNFELLLPLAAPESRGGDESCAPAIAMEDEPGFSTDRGFRMMVVDDEPANLAVMKSFLEIRGVSPLLATGGYEAITLAARERPQLILMDIHMSACDGFEALEKIRANDDLSGVQVVAMTASASESDRVRYVEAGFDGFLAKPIASLKLDELLNQFVPSSAFNKKRQDGMARAVAPKA